jgi:hypothetical protein
MVRPRKICINTLHKGDSDDDDDDDDDDDNNNNSLKYQLYCPNFFIYILSNFLKLYQSEPYLKFNKTHETRTKNTG